MRCAGIFMMLIVLICFALILWMWSDWWLVAVVNSVPLFFSFSAAWNLIAIEFRKPQ